MNLYIDKTRQIYELMEMGSLYFLSRPRRFGKSLLISILKQIFKGNQDLFKNLYIGTQTDYSWKKYPVLQFNFADFGFQQLHIEEALEEDLENYAKAYHIKLPKKNLSSKFKSLVTQIATNDKPVVILVDEYDKPIIDFLTDKVQAKKNRKVLKKFFAPLKGLEEKGHLHFLFITGVSKFSRVSIFSDLNNLTDITVNKKMADLVGITEAELLQNFEPNIQNAIQDLSISRERLLKELKLWYDGYSWDGKTFVYNPFSLLNFFNDTRFAIISSFTTTSVHTCKPSNDFTSSSPAT